MLKTLEKYRDAVFFTCLVGSIVTLPFSIKINSIAIICLVVAWLFKNSIKEKFQNIHRPLFYLSISLYAVYLSGMLWTSNIEHGIFELEKKLSLLIFPVILASVNRIKREEINKIVYYFAISCVLASFVCLIYASYRSIAANSFFEINPQSNYVTHYFFYYGLSDIFIHPVYFSAYIVFSICILFNYLIDNKGTNSRKRNILIIALILYLILFLCLLSSRIMILGFLILGLLYFIYSYTKTKRGMKLSLGIFALVIVVVSVAYVPAIRERFSEIINSSYHFENNPEANKNLSGKVDGIQMKLAQWYFTLEAGKNNWLFGVGTGDDEDELQKTYLQNNFMEGYIPRFNSHNQYFQTWLGLGLVGLSILLLCFFIPVFIAFKQKNILYLIFLFIVMFFCLTESVFCRQNGIVFYAFFNSLFAFHSLERK